MEGWGEQQRGDSGKQSCWVRVGWGGRSGPHTFIKLMRILKSRTAMFQYRSFFSWTWRQTNRSQSQPNTFAAFPLTQLVHYPFFRDVATSSLIRGSHILWRHQSTSQQISYCQVGKSFCWPSHLWLLSLWVAPVYSALTGRLPRPIASQTGLVLFKPCGKWLIEKVRGAQFSPPTRRKKNQTRSCLKELLDLGNWKETA